MKKLFRLAAVSVLGIVCGMLLGRVAHAQNNLMSGSTATTNSTAGATNAGNAQNINFNSDSTGRTTLHSAPALGGQAYYGSFSPDSCVTSGGGGVSFLPGVAANFATPVKDEECSLRRNVQTTMQMAVSLRNHGDINRSVSLEAAAIDIMCQTNEATRRAYTKAGLCGPEFSQPPLTVDEQRAARQQRRLNDVYSPG